LEIVADSVAAGVEGDVLGEEAEGAAGAVGAGAFAQESAVIDLAFLNTWYHPENVTGLRVGIPWGDSESVTGIDVGFYGRSTKMAGIGVNLVANIVKDRADAIQVACYNYAGTLSGAQVGLMNRTGYGALGWDTRLMFSAAVQVGVLNIANDLRGVQVGLINQADMLYGFQFGLVNVIKSGTIPFMPIVNVGF